MPKSSVVDLNSATANMYGCEPCPNCGNKYRWIRNDAPDVIQCDGCTLEEEITERKSDYQ